MLSIILQGVGVRYFSGSVAINLRRSSLRPTPGGPMSTMGLKTPGLGNNFATSSYVGISSRSKSSFSVQSYIIFLILDREEQWGDDWSEDLQPVKEAREGEKAETRHSPVGDSGPCHQNTEHVSLV